MDMIGDTGNHFNLNLTDLMDLFLLQKHMLRIIWLLALFGLNPLELSKEAPTVGAFTWLAFSSLLLIYLRELSLTGSAPTKTPLAIHSS